MSRDRGDRRRVVVTGLGCVTPLGADVSTTWDAAVAGRCAVSRLTGSFDERLPVRIGAQISGSVDAGELSAKEERRLDRVILFALAAARQAVDDAELEATDPSRIGVAVGTAIGGLGTLLSNHRALLEAGPRRVSPYFIPMTLCNMPGGYVAIRHGLRGPNLCHVSACASGAHSLGEAMRTIQRGDADVMLAGGCEACVNELVISGFARMQALSRRDDDPGAASRPFDEGRDGFVVGEGAAVLVVESLEHARARGARVRAELAGYAATADAAHVASPDPDFDGAARCIRLALEDAGVGPAGLDYINAHATSTPAGDRVEAQAIRSVLGAEADRVAVSSTKGMTGHLLGAAGAVEALFCVRALETGLLPPTINLDRPDPDCALDHVANKTRRVPTRTALSNSFGFGGVNAALVLRRWEA